MPAWITSLLRDEVTVPIPSAASRMITSRPACASRRATARPIRSEEHTSELQSLRHLVCRLLLEKKKKRYSRPRNTDQRKQDRGRRPGGRNVDYYNDGAEELPPDPVVDRGRNVGAKSASLTPHMQ